MPENDTTVDFATLQDIYNAERLVLIVGSDILKVNNSGKTFEHVAIEKIVNQSFEKMEKSFSDVAIEYPNFTISNNKLIGIYKGLNEPDFDTTLVELIADLPKVKLIIQTSFDSKLKEKLGEDNVETIVWNHKKREPVFLDLKNGKRKLFYLFGDTTEGISVFEEEQIDCLLNLSIYNEINKNKTADRYSFLENLNDKTLVFIGNNFPDWFMRLMVRTLYNTSLTAEPDKAYIINDNSKEIKFKQYFFEKFKIKLIHDSPIENFLQKFHDLVVKESDFINKHDNKKVFISYDRHDSLYANEIKKKLNIKGIDAFLDTSDMGIAEHLKKIKDFIQSPTTVVFICVLSQFLADRNKNQSYVKLNEWKIAEGRYLANKYLADTYTKDTAGKTLASTFHIVPIAVDDFKKYIAAMPDFIQENNTLKYLDDKYDNDIDDLLNNMES